MADSGRMVHPWSLSSSRFTSPTLARARGLQPHAPISKALRFTIAGGESRWSLLLALRSFWSRSGRYRRGSLQPVVT